MPLDKETNLFISNMDTKLKMKSREPKSVKNIRQIPIKIILNCLFEIDVWKRLIKDVHRHNHHPQYWRNLLLNH